MKRKRGAPKALADVEDAVFILPTEPEKPEPEPEDPGVAEWNAFAQDHYELVEQLPLSLHRSFSLIRELDDLVQENTSRIVPATRAYIALRESMLRRPKHAEHSPSGLDLLAHVSAAVEPPAQSSVPALPGQEPGPAPNPVPNLAPTPPPAQPNGVVPMDEDKTPAEAPADPAPISSGPPADPVQHSADLAPAHPALVPPAPSFPTDSRALLTLIATLASDAVRASNEKVGIANTVYQTVDNHLQALDALIAQHKSTLPHQPSPDPIPPPLQHSPAPSSPTPSSPTKSRSRRRTRATDEKEPPGDEADGEDEQQSIPPLRITRTNGTTPTAVRVRSRSVSKPKPRDQVEDGASGSPTRKGKNVFPPKGSSNSGSSKGNSASSRNPQKLPPNSSNNQPRGTTTVPVPKTPRRNGKKSGTDGDDKYKRYCFCGDMSFGEMIACDNNCEREWFHLPCVGLEVAPKSKWYCNDCDPQNNPNSKKKQRKS